MNTQIVFRLLGSENRADYKSIRLECLQNYPENFGTLYEDEVNASALKFDDVISKNNGTDFLMGAFENEHLIGICGFMQEKRTKTMHIGEISQMYVKPESGKQGVGANLLRLSIEKAFLNKTVDQIMLGVVQSNAQAIHVYLKTGFKQYGHVANYYKKDDQYEGMVFMILTRQSFESTK